VAPQGTTRQKMLASAVELLRERGAAGVTVDAILARSGAPRGSVYHHFPGGRNQIMAEALELAGDAITAIINESSAGGPLSALRTFSALWTQLLRGSDFTAGCPVVAAAVGGAPEDQQLVPAVAEIFTRWHDALVEALISAGAAQTRAARLATMSVAAVEGAVILCRAARSTQPLEDVMAELELMLAETAPGTSR
jgi:TetR/AcrR family transcriptional repressor of lmrAB and yxaGH operons